MSLIFFMQSWVDLVSCFCRFILFLTMCICMWEYVHVSAGMQRVLDPLEPELQIILSGSWNMDAGNEI